MSKELELAKKLYDAFDKKDKKALDGLIHPDYTGIMPGMEIKGIDALLGCMDMCPFESHSENVTYIQEGDRLVRFWDMVSTAPVKFRMRMVELAQIKDGKLYYTETVCDTNSFPPEAKALFKCDSEAKPEKALSK